MALPFFNLRGYQAADPLDKATNFKQQYLIIAAVNVLLSIVLIYGITASNVVVFNGFEAFGMSFSPVWTMGIEVIINAFVFTFFILFLRKSSSLVIAAIIFIPYFLIELRYETLYRAIGQGQLALWNYGDPSIVSSVQPPVLKYFLTMSFDALVFGILALYIARVVASFIFKNKEYPIAPTQAQFNNLFNDEWSLDKVLRPKRDAAYWILRGLGLGYLLYLTILALGIFGSKAWFEGVQMLMDMTYQNPALAINTYLKIGVMMALAFMGAYNIRLRYYACAGLIFGHGVSTIFSLAFYFFVKNTNPEYRDFLLTSAIVDGVMVIAFVWIMLKYKQDAKAFAREKDFPINFSIPMTLMRKMYIGVSIFFTLFALIILCFRLFGDGDGGFEAVYGSPDPQLGNTITLYSTLGFLAFLLINRHALRVYLFDIILFPLTIGSGLTLLWITIGGIVSDVTILTRTGNSVSVDWYFVLKPIVQALVAFAMISVRKMYYNIDCGVNTLSPSSAINVMALTDALFEGDAKHHSAVLQSIDRYVGGIRGRKRGLMNLPFGLLENVFHFFFGFRARFSTLSRAEQRYFLSRYIFRNEFERKRAFIPVVADIAYQIGMALNSIVMFAHYSTLNVRHKVGYVPADARDRLQGDIATARPPFSNTAALPKDENDALNFKPNHTEKLIAPRVTTPVREYDIPDEVDYIIIGSGAGGATAAYRLACTVADPSRILVVERGNRYQPLQDFEDSEIEMMKKLYKEGGLQQTKKFNMTLLQGECVGGTTVINNGVCFQIPLSIKEDWANNYDIDLSNLDNEYAQIGKELDIQPLGDLGINQNVESRFKHAIHQLNAALPNEEKLQTHFPVMVNHRQNNGDGNWNLGNKRMRKRSMLETFIPWAEARGVKIVSNVTAVRFVASAGKGTSQKAESVILRADNGQLTTVNVKKAVIMAGGVVASSHLLMRSDIANPNIGKNLSCNFALPVAFRCEEKINAFDGDQITMAAVHPHLKGAFETYFNPPASFAMASIPFFFEKRDAMMQHYAHSFNLGALVGSEANGIIQKKADILNGQPFTWQFGAKDVENVKYAINTLLEIGRLAGSVEAVIPTKPGIRLDLTKPENLVKFKQHFADYPLRMDDLFLGTAHPQGGNFMAGKNATATLKAMRVVDEQFKVAGYDNVYVADASLFPTSITINPQWTIMAMSSMAAKSVLSDWA